MCIAPSGPKIQRRLMQHRITKCVWTYGFSSGVWKWECFRTVECQQVESSRWMEQPQKKREGPVRCISSCERGTTSSGELKERRARDDAWVCTSSLRYFGVAVVLTLLVRLLTLRPSQRIWARADVWRVLALAVQHLMFFSNFWDQVVAALFSNSVMWSVYQWRNQRGAVAAAPPLAENLSCTAYYYCTILRFTGRAIVIEI